MARSDDLNWAKAVEYPPKEFAKLSAEDVLKWLKNTNRFLQKFLTTEELLRSREIRSKSR